MIEGYTPVPVEHFGGLICSWPPEMLDVSLLAEALNLRFTEAELQTREGLSVAFRTPTGLKLAGLADYARLDGTEQPIVLDAGGNFYTESPAGSGALQKGNPVGGFTVPAGASMQAASAFNRSYLAFGNGKTGSGAPGVFDGTLGTLAPATPAGPASGATLADAASAGLIAPGLRYGVVLFKFADGSLSPPSPAFSYSAASIVSPPDAPLLSVETFASGFSTLPSGTYFVVLTFKTAAGETMGSTEVTITVPPAPSGDSYGLQITWPAYPAGAVSFGLYVGTASGGEKLQNYFSVGGTAVTLVTPIATGGAAPPSSNTAALAMAVTGIPLGPAETVARVLAFTVAGGSSAGPYYYIGESQIVDGATETSTVIGDNTTTTGLFSFDDDFLADAVDVTDEQRAIALPDVCAVAFSQNTQRLMWWGDPAQPSVVYCSEPDDAGTYYGDTGFFQVQQGSGQRVTAVFEYRTQIYAAITDGLYLVTPNNGDPATWDVSPVAPKTGICGPRAVDVGTGFAIFVHRTGVYQFDGGVPTRVSDELMGPAPNEPGLWERINWAYDYLIWVAIDHEAKCVRIGVPLDGATQCSHILKVSYLDGWEASIRFSPFTARYHYFPGRRWSLDTIAASQGVRVKRPLALGGMPADRRLGQSQVLLASTQGSAVYYVDPGAQNDDGNPFPFQMRTGAASASELLRQNRQGMEMLGIVQLRCSGSGNIQAQAVQEAGRATTPVDVALPPDNAGDVSLLPLAQGEAVGIRLSGVGAKLRLRAMYLFCKPTWALRPGLRVP